MITLAFLGHLYFHINFRISLSISAKKKKPQKTPPAGIFIEITLEFCIYKICHLQKDIVSLLPFQPGNLLLLFLAYWLWWGSRAMMKTSGDSTCPESFPELWETQSALHYQLRFLDMRFLKMTFLMLRKFLLYLVCRGFRSERCWILNAFSISVKITMWFVHLLY